MQLKKTVLGFVGATLLAASLATPAMAQVTGSRDGSVVVGGETVATINLTLDDVGWTFGNMSPLGGGASDGISEYVDPDDPSQGAAYSRDQGPFRTFVSSNVNYSLTLMQTGNTGNSVGLDNLLYGAYLGASFGNYDAAIGSNTSVPTTATQVSSGDATTRDTLDQAFTFRVDWTDGPGTLNTTLTYSASQVVAGP